MRRRGKALSVLVTVVTGTALTVTMSGGASAAAAPQAGPGEFAEELRVAGVLRKFAVDIKAAEAADLHGFAGAERGPRYAIRTADGATVPLDAESLPSTLATAPDGARVTAEVTLTPDAVDELGDAGVDVDDLADTGRVTKAAAQVLDGAEAPVEVSAVVSLATGSQTGKTGTSSDSVAAATTRGLRHKSYVLAVQDSAAGKVSKAKAEAITAAAGAYWTQQSQGGISAFGVSEAKTWTLAKSCSLAPDDLWTRGEAKFPGVRFDALSGNHLVIFLPAGCQKKLGYAGLGTIGADLASGGEVIVVDGAVSVLAHEFGHNLGLGHSNLDVGQCGAVSSAEYYGLFGPQSAAVADYPPGTLDVAYQWVLGTAKSANLRSLSTADGRTTVTLAPVFAPSGTRGIRFVDPVDKATYFVEYRPGVDADANTYYASFLGRRPMWLELSRARLDFTPGVRVYRLRPAMNDLETVTVLRDGTYDTTLRKGKTYVAPSGGFRVTAKSATAGAATVDVELGRVTAASATKASVPKVTYGKAATATVQVAADGPICGKAEVHVDGRKAGTTKVTAGAASYRLPAGLKSGTHTVTVKYLGSKSVKASTGSVKVTVAKAKAPVTLSSISTVKRGAKAKVTVKLKAVGAQAPTGKVHLTVGSKKVTGAVTVKKSGSSWTAKLTTSKLPRGAVKIVYGGNVNLAGAVYSTGRTVR